MPGTLQSNSTTYLSIVGGKLRQKVTSDTPGAVLREGEMKDGTHYSKYELVFNEWSGLVTGIAFEDGKFGEQLLLDMEDARITISTNSKYFSYLATRICNADLSKPITLKPYDFESDDGKKLQGINIFQGDVKLTDFFFDGENSINGMPVPQKPRDEMSKNDWKMYFLQRQQFLVEKLGDLKIPQGNSQVREVPQDIIADEEVKIDGLPF